MVSEELDTIR